MTKLFCTWVCLERGILGETMKPYCNHIFQKSSERLTWFRSCWNMISIMFKRVSVRKRITLQLQFNKRKKGDELEKRSLVRRSSENTFSNLVVEWTIRFIAPRWSLIKLDGYQRFFHKRRVLMQPASNSVMKNTTCVRSSDNVIAKLFNATVNNVVSG